MKEGRIMQFGVIQCSGPFSKCHSTQRPQKLIAIFRASMIQSAEYGTFRRDLRCARRNFFCSLLSILNSLLKISGVQVPYSAHQSMMLDSIFSPANKH